MGTYILLIGQNSPLRERLTAVLASQGWLVAVAADASESQRKAAAHGEPALQIYLPDAVQAAVESSAELPRQTHLLALIASQQADDVKASDTWLHFDDFVIWSDYEANPKKEAELCMRVSRLLKPSLPPATRGKAGATEYGQGSMRLASEQNWRIRLSATERRIVTKLEEAGGQVVPMDELAKCVHGSTQQGRFNSLRVHITRLRRKIEVDPAQPRCVRTVRGVGYCLDVTGALRAQSHHGGD